jgi:type IV pilus assembly protein PilQ
VFIAALVTLTAATCALPAAEKPRQFSLDFVQTEMVDVIKALAAQSGVNIATNGSAQGTVTLRLNNVTLEQALTIVTRLNGLEYAVLDGTYVVGKPDEIAALKAATFISRAVTLSRLKPADAQQTVTKVAPDVSISSQPGTPTVLLLGPPSGVQKAEAILREMDSTASTAPPATEIAQLKHMPASQALEIVRGAVPAVQVSPGTTGTILLTGDPLEIAKARAVLSGVDVVPSAGAAERVIYRIKYAEPYELQEKLTELLPDLKVTLGPRSATPTVTSSTSGASASALANVAAPQMTTSGAGAAAGYGASSGGAGGARVQLSTVTTLILVGSRPTLDSALELLKELDTAPRQLTISATISEVQKGALSQLGIDWQGLGAKTGIIVGEPIPSTTGSRELKLGKFMRSQLQFNGVISALVSRNRAKILANPTITLLEGTQASIHAGEKIYYGQQVGLDFQGKPIYTTTQIDVGVMLAVRPQVSDNGDITLTLVPTVSALVENMWFPDYPATLERSTVTTVRVKSGETLVLAGLVRDDEIVTSTRVPLLGDLPIVGRLFRYERKQPQHTEIVIAITPTIKEEKG